MANKMGNLASIKSARNAQFLLLFAFLVMQNLLIPSNASPAKPASSSRSLDFHGTDPDGAIVNNGLQPLVESEPKFPIKITVYPWNNHLGRPAPIEWETEEEVTSLTCKEVPSRWQRKVRSVNTHNECFVLYSQLNCGGSFKIVKPESPSHNRLSDICFQRKTLSIRPCNKKEKESPITDHV